MKQPVVYIVEYQVSARGETQTLTSAIALTWEQFQQWLSLWGKDKGPANDDLVEEVEAYFDEHSTGEGFFFTSECAYSCDAAKVLEKVKDGRRSFVFEAEEGLLGIGKNFKRIVGAMRAVELTLDSDICDFDNADFDKPSLPVV